MGNKQEYLAALREELKRYPWAADEQRLNRYVDRAREALEPVSPLGFEWDGAASVAAWRAIGGKGKPKLHELRDLA